MSEPRPATPLSRRAVVVGAGAAGAGLALAACATVGTGTSGGSAGSGSGGAASAPAGTALGAAADVPVGGATIFKDQGVVVTQATAGAYAGFSTICPHQGCAVGSVEGDRIICPCHNSMFALDGSVTTGPALTGLEPRAVTVAGDQVTLA